MTTESEPQPAPNRIQTTIAQMQEAVDRASIFTDPHCLRTNVCLNSADVEKWLRSARSAYLSLDWDQAWSIHASLRLQFKPDKDGDVHLTVEISTPTCGRDIPSALAMHHLLGQVTNLAALLVSIWESAKIKVAA